MTQLSIVIPCYNESGALHKVFRICREAISEKEGIEFIFVNNGSTDDSGSLFTELMQLPENHFARLVDIPVNLGYGYGILKGLSAAKGEVLAWTHADMQTDPSDVLVAYNKYKAELLSQQYIVKGRRMKRNLFDVFFTASMSAFASLLLGTNLSDVNAQPKMFHRNFMSKLTKAPNDFALDLYLLYVAKREGLQILSFPVLFKKRLTGEAKGGASLKGKIKLTKRTLAFIFETRKAIKKGER